MAFDPGSIDGIDIDALMNLPSEVEGDRVSVSKALEAFDSDLSSLSDIPAELQLSSILIDFPSHEDGGDSVQVQTRVPSHWIAQADQIREKVGTRLPNVWPTKGAFYRWCIYIGLDRLRQLDRIFNTKGIENLDPILSARLHLEKTGGRLEARAQVMIDAKRQAKAIIEAASIYIEDGLYPEAANLINEWAQSAHELRTDHGTPHWEEQMMRALMMDIEAIHVIEFLLDRGYIEDDYLQGLVHQFEIAKRKREEADPYGVSDISGGIGSVEPD